MAKQHGPRFLALVEEAKQRVGEITVLELRKKFDASDSFYLVDVREESEWTEGRIPGAQHLSKGIIERDIETTIPDRNANIILYCGGGFRSALAASNLQKMGYQRVLSLAGGWRAWCDAGFPVAKD